MIHGPSDTWHPFTPRDRATIGRIGACPLKVMLPKPQDFAWLAGMGFAEHDLVIRAWVGENDLPEPAAHVAGIVHQVLMARQAGFSRIAVQFSCEDEAERYARGWHAIRAWSLAVVALLRRDLPGIEVVSTPIQPGAPHSWEARQAMDEVINLCDSVGVHVKWRNIADLKPDAPWSEEWWHGQFPGKPQRLLEVGGWPGTPHEWRLLTYPDILSRFTRRSYVKSVHVWLVRSEDPQWQPDFYTEALTPIVANAAHEWRVLRPLAVEVVQ